MILCVLSVVSGVLCSQVLVVDGGKGKSVLMALFLDSWTHCCQSEKPGSAGELLAASVQSPVLLRRVCWKALGLECPAELAVPPEGHICLTVMKPTEQLVATPGHGG